MQFLKSTLVRFAWLSVASIVSVTRPSVAQSDVAPAGQEPAAPTPEPSEPGPLQDDPAVSTPAPTDSVAPTVPAPAVLPPTGAFPVDPTPAPVARPAQAPRADLKTQAAQTPAAPASTTPTPIPPKASVNNDTPFNDSSSNTSSASSSSARPVSEPPESTPSEASSSRVIRLGPVVGVGLPGLISIGGLLKLTSYLGFGVNMGLIPSMHISYYGDATLAYQEYDAYGRLFPFGGGFFMGAGVGYATIKGTMKDTFDTAPYQAQATLVGISVPNPLTYQSEGTVKTMIVTPQIGYFYTTDIGFSIGLDVGAQVPIAPSQVSYRSHLSLPPGTPSAVANGIQSDYVAPNDKKVRDTLQTIGRTPLPTFNLKIGWLF